MRRASSVVWRTAGMMLALSALASVISEAPAQKDGTALRIGASSSLSVEKSAEKEKAAVESLRAFIKEQTGFDNVIHHEKTWIDLAEKMAKGEEQLGTFPGYEFGWASDKDPKIKPLAVAVNGIRYPVAAVVVRKDSRAKDIADTRGAVLALPSTSQSLVRLFVLREAQNGNKKETFFGKVIDPENIEDALDDVVDKVAGVAAVDSAGLEAYKRRKPGRANQLKEIARSKPFPPVVLAYYEGALDAKTLARFRDGLLNANRQKKGQMLLTLFRLTGFEEVPSDFNRVMTDTVKVYPPE